MLLVLVFGIMAVGWIGVELCQKECGFFRSEKSGPAYLEPWNPSLSAMLFVLMLLIASDFLYNIHKDYGEKGVLIRK